MQEYKIAVPYELLNASKIDFTKPVYLYWFCKHLYISNKKRKKQCLGQIFVDKEYTFSLTQNAIKVVLGCSDYIMHVSYGEIFISPHTKYVYDIKATPRFTIPKEILEIGNIDFKKAVYLCFNKYENESYYLSNRQDQSYCLGCIPFDENHSFVLSRNICKTLGISSAEELSVYVSDKKIYFKTYREDVF